MEPEQTIASHLFLHGQCILPGVGTLRLETAPAQVDYATRQIKAPEETIAFVADDRTPSVSNELLTASQLLRISLDNNGSTFLKGIGTFSRDKEHVIRFTPIELDEAYTPLLQVSSLVKTEPVVIKKPGNRWWWWIALLALLALGLIVVYIYTTTHTAATPWGNKQVIQPANEPVLYKTGN